MQRLREACRGRRISELPVHVLYHILEYLHWDWFEELYEYEEDASPSSPNVGKVSAPTVSLWRGVVLCMR
jgi:hypothetical protein